MNVTNLIKDLILEHDGHLAWSCKDDNYQGPVSAITKSGNIVNIWHLADNSLSVRINGIEKRYRLEDPESINSIIKALTEDIPFGQELGPRIGNNLVKEITNVFTH